VLEVVERVCTRIVIINRGEMIAQGTAVDIAAAAGEPSLERAFVAMTGTRDAGQITQDLLEALER
jgi:ABC-type Na+ transport system ATPase subunit NatA